MIRVERSSWWRVFAWRIAGSLLVTVVTCSLRALTAQDSAPAPTLTAAQQEKLKGSEALWKQGFELLSGGKLAEATTTIKTAIAIERDIYGDEHNRVLEIMSMLAELHELQEQFPAATAVRNEMLVALTKRFGAAHWRVTDERIAIEDSQRRGRLTRQDRMRLGEAVQASGAVDTLFAQGQFSDALERATFVVERRRELIGEQNSTFALSLAKLALIHGSLGNRDQAESLYQQAIVIEKQTLGEQHPEYATTLSNLAVLCDANGQYSKSERLYLQAQDIRRQTLGEQHSDYATSLNNLAVHYDQLGDSARAESLYLQAVELKRQTLGEQHADYMTSLNNLGRHLQSRGELVRAEPILVKAMELRKQFLGEQHPQYAGSLNNLALLYAAQHDAARAEPMFRQALEILKQKFGELHSNYATTLGHLADLHLTRGECAAAETLYREVVEIRRRALGEQHPHFAMALSKLSLSLLHQEKLDEALLLARQAVEIDGRNVAAVAAIQSDRQQFLTAKQSYATLDVLLQLVVRNGHATDAEYHELLQAKGRVWLRQQMARATARAAADQPELAKLVTELRSLAANRGRLMLNVPSPKGQDAWRKQLAELVEQQESRERELAEKSVALRTARQPISPADVRHDLPEDAVLIDVFEYLHALTPSAKPMTAVHERRSVAFILRRDVPGVSLVSLGNVKPISKAIDTWRQSLGKLPEAQAAARLLKQKVWEPIEPHLAGAKLVLISPDGALGRFPLAALPGKKPDTYLLEDVSLAVIPCAMAIPRFLANDDSQPRTEVAGNLLIAANIDYEAASSPPAMEPVRKFGRQLTAVRGADWKGFTPLDATRGELASIEKLYRDTFGREGITILEGAQAREERFCAEAVRHKYLHLATHGFFAPSSLKSALHDSQEQVRSAPISSTAVSQFIGYPPGLLSGIALSGANRDPEPDRDDGILTASEVENLDLRGVQLVVLSACETGLGEVAGGEGLLGLQRAFQVAGTQTVVASLWEVSDTATRTLMERFYDNLLRKKMGTLDSLREAQLGMLHEGPQRGLIRLDQPQSANDPKRTPPFYWAAFVLSGDWR